MSYLCSNPTSIFPSHSASFRPFTWPTWLRLLLDLCSHFPLVFFLLISSHSLAFLPFLKPTGYYLALLYLHLKCSLLELSSPRYQRNSLVLISSCCCSSSTFIEEPILFVSTLRHVSLLTFFILFCFSST